jgi:hypothetical protein
MLLAITLINAITAINNPDINKFCNIINNFVYFFADLSNVITNNVKITVIHVINPVDSNTNTRSFSLIPFPKLNRNIVGCDVGKEDGKDDGTDDGCDDGFSDGTDDD